MTRPADDGTLARLAAAVDEAIPRELARSWSDHVAHEPLLVKRQGIFSALGHVFAYQISPEMQARSTAGEDLAASHVLHATFGRDDLEGLARGRHIFVRCPRPYLLGELPLPHRPDRLVVELPVGLEADTTTLSGITALRSQGYRVSLPSFVDLPSQRRLLPLADFVKIDVRDLDVEGHPVVRVARAYGATLVGEFVEHPAALAYARDLGIALFQGNLLERAGVVDRASARPVGL